MKVNEKEVTQEEYYQGIKSALISNEVYKRVKDFAKNKSDLDTYYKVGKILYDAGKNYGENIIKQYSERLTNELGKGYTITRLKYMRRFYNVFEKSPTMSDQLTFSHYCEVIWYNKEKMNYYINLVKEQNLSVRELRSRIKSTEYERLPKETKKKLIKKEETTINDNTPNPIIINNPKNIDITNEKILQELIVEYIEDFMPQLGIGYSYIGHEVTCNIKGEKRYIDILLFNIKYNAYVVVELKTRKLDIRDIGQIESYMNYVDNYIKEAFNNKTIGIIICKKGSEYIIEYSSNEALIARNYVIN